MPELPPDPGWRVCSKPAPLPRGSVTSDCGPEALAAVLRYYGKPADVDELTARIYRKDAKGTLTSDMAEAARERGLAAEFCTGDVHRIRKEVGEDAPSIIQVEVKPGLNHFFVVIGYNDARRELAAEAYDGLKYLLTYEEVERGWSAAEQVMLLLRPAGASADLETADDLASTGHFAEAIPYYRRALDASRDDVRAWIGLGTCLAATKDSKGALAAYEEARKIDPANPLACNNLADLLIGLGGRVQEAEDLADRAVAEYQRRCETLESEKSKVRPAQRLALMQELADAYRDLAGARGTLGQARFAARKFDLAIAAWQASFDAMPLDESDWRATRQLEMGDAYRELGQPAQARKCWLIADSLARDPALKARIADRLK